MLWFYDECLKQYGTDYQIKKATANGEIFKIEKGIYSDQKFVPEISVITKKYPKAILTMNTAFYYYAVTDVIPDQYYLVTDKNDAKIRDERVIQIFESQELLKIGVTEIERQGIPIRIYDKERMLIELIRRKNKLPYDYYKEIIHQYRKLIFELDVERVQEYAAMFPKSGMITETLQTEVF